MNSFIPEERFNMTKKNFAFLMEWLRPTGIGLAIFSAY